MLWFYMQYSNFPHCCKMNSLQWVLFLVIPFNVKPNHYKWSGVAACITLQDIITYTEVIRPIIQCLLYNSVPHLRTGTITSDREGS